MGLIRAVRGTKRNILGSPNRPSITGKGSLLVPVLEPKPAGTGWRSVPERIQYSLDVGLASPGSADDFDNISIL